MTAKKKRATVRPTGTRNKIIVRIAGGMARIETHTVTWSGRTEDLDDDMLETLTRKHRECYDRTRNEAHIWRVRKLHRERGVIEPVWVTEAVNAILDCHDGRTLRVGGGRNATRKMKTEMLQQDLVEAALTEQTADQVAYGIGRHDPRETGAILALVAERYHVDSDYVQNHCYYKLTEPDPDPAALPKHRRLKTSLKHATVIEKREPQDNNTSTDYMPL